MLGAYWYGAAVGFPRGQLLVTHLRELKKHGVGRYIPQMGLDGARHYIERNAVAKVCEDEGIELVCGLGLDSRSRSTKEHEPLVRAAILEALGAVRLVSLNWEGWWRGPRRRLAAARIAQAVLDQHPDAPARCTDCPWWAPLYYIDDEGKRRPTHPSAPTVEFGTLVRVRYPQCYGAQQSSPDGRSLAMLRWSRAPSQYASLGDWRINVTTQLYHRSLNDFVQTLLTEPEQNLWTWNQISRIARLALRVVEELRKRGFTGPDAVRMFQRAERLDVDNVVGPITLYHLGLGKKP